MYKAIGVWSRPREEDLAEFERHYEQVHCALAEKLPGVRRVTVFAGDPSAPAGGIFRLAEVYWDDRMAFERASESEEWHVMAADAMQLMDRYGVTMTVADGEEIVMPSATA